MTPSALAAALEERGPDVDCVDGDMLQCARKLYTKAPPNTRMGRLEAALIYGCGDSPYPKATLGAHLEASAAPSVESLRRWVAAARKPRLARSCRAWHRGAPECGAAG